MSGKINSHICLMFCLQKFSSTVKYGEQAQHRNHILQDLSTTEIWFAKNLSINISS